jgi:hypothetical protein
MVISPRKLFVEDCQLTIDPNAPQVASEVLGVGIVNLTQIDAVRYSAFTQAANDAAAATAGVGLGFIYYNTTSSALKARMN